MRDRDHRRMDTMARDLASIETNEPQSSAALDRAVNAANRDRAKRGIPPLERDEPHPEEELYRRARALGLRRHRR